MGKELQEGTTAEVSGKRELAILSLPFDVLAAVFRCLSECDIYSCACVCTTFRNVAMDDVRIWKPLCYQRWSDRTNPELWIVEKSTAWQLGSNLQYAAPHCYRFLYRLLDRYEQLVGVWQGQDADHGPRGGLYVNQWRPDSIDCFRLVPDRMEIRHKHHLKLRPHELVTGHVLDGSHLVLKEYKHLAGGHKWSGHATAAASVAAGTLSSEESPPRNFENELVRFMQSSVRTSRRNSCRRTHRLSQGLDIDFVPRLHYMLRLVVPVPTKNTSLAGIWKGFYGQHGLEIIKVEYDFSGVSAQIVATKLLGDPNVPAGETTWQAQAKGVGDPPWDMLDARVNELGRAFAMSGAQEELGQVKVMNCHHGHGQIAQYGFVNPEWIEGELWELSNGNIGFLWGDYHNSIIFFMRAGADLDLCSASGTTT